MAKQTDGSNETLMGHNIGIGKREGRGKDAPYHEMESGVVFAPVGFSNDAGFGTPPAPTMRGDTDAPGTGTLPGASASKGIPKKNSVVSSFFMKD